MSRKLMIIWLKSSQLQQI